MSECRNFGKAESLCQLAELSCANSICDGAVSSNSMLSCRQQSDETIWRTLIGGLDVLRAPGKLKKLSIIMLEVCWTSLTSLERYVILEHIRYAVWLYNVITVHVNDEMVKTKQFVSF